METVTKRLYEGMFLLDSAKASDWDGVVEIIETLLKRSDAEIASIRKWDERKLAYEVDRQTRGTYVLTYFKAEGGRIREIEKDVQLSDKIMRVLILSAEQMTQEDIDKDTPATKVEKSKLKHKAAVEAERAEKEALAESKQRAEEVAEGKAAEETVAGEVSEGPQDSEKGAAETGPAAAVEVSKRPLDSEKGAEEPAAEATGPDQAVSENEDGEQEKRSV